MGRAPCCDKTKVKRGPWSPEEDNTLKEYVGKHGTGGNWIALPHKAGLKRCGKSCRLRWLNYLRPDIKHGGFTEDEDNIILSLYNRIGSRWSIIASHLQGRTDNDVKNYWNTKLKKRLLSGKVSLPTTPTPTPFNHQSSDLSATNHPMNFNFVSSVQSPILPNSESKTFMWAFPSDSAAVQWQQNFCPEMMVLEPNQSQLPGLVEVSENGISPQYGFIKSASSSQEISSLSPSFSLESSYASWASNGGSGLDQEDGFLIELGGSSSYDISDHHGILMDGFDFQEQKPLIAYTDFDDSLGNNNYSYNSSLLANFSDSLTVSASEFQS